MPLNPAQVPPHISAEFRTPVELLARNDIVVPQLYAWHAKENPNYPLFMYNNGKHLEYITYATANNAMDRAARYVTSLDPTKKGVIGVLANTDTITYFSTSIGAQRSGWTVFMISTRNTAAAVVDMVKKTGTSHLLVSADPAMSDIAEEAIQSLANEGVKLERHAMPVFEDLYSEKPKGAFAAQVELPTSYDVNSFCLIMHSSGSTGHPKPIKWTYARMSGWGREPLRFEMDVKGSIMSCHGTPMFHGLGAFLYSASPVVGFVLATFKPSSPPLVPTPDAVWEGIIAAGVDFTWSVPSFIEQWSRDPEKVQVLKTKRGVMFGGAALDDQVGNFLASQGTSLFSVYGATEVGLINAFARPNPGMDWAYWAPTPGIQCAFRPVDEGTYELVILSPPEMPLPMTNTKERGQDAYATSDIVVPHPTIPGLWKIFGRADDQIILSNGEKTNPVPLEKIINDDVHIRSSIIFGRGKFQNGVLIEPTEEHAIDPSDEKQLEGFRNKIWPTIDKVNEYAPQHSRLFKEMILVTSPSKPFKYNAKAIPRRSVVLGDYHDEIEKAYKDVENSAQSDIPSPEVWDEESTLAFVRTVLQSTLRHTIPDDADIFRNGADSLQATWIRNTILRAVRETAEDAAKRIPMDIVFASPTIAGLAHSVHAAVQGSEGVGARTPEDLWRYVEKYAKDLPARPAHLAERPAGRDVVVITGTTGGFGCDALEHLLRDESVERVYAFNRNNAHVAERQRTQFRARGLDESLLYSKKFVLVGADLHEPGFGVAPELLDEIRRSVTHIMHNAWKVNFNLSVASFAADIQSARNFVDFALSSPFTKPPPVVFVSSIGIFDNTKAPSPVAEAPNDDPASPFGIGYAEAKWITEHMLQVVSERSDVHTVVVRLGQVAGDRLGYWNEKEWFPALVKSAQFQRCLPDLEGSVSWFPAYEAAKAFTQMRHSRYPILHIAHPRPAAWHTVMAPIAEAFGVPLVPYAQWLKALQEGAQPGSAAEVEALKKNPALHLVAFFKSQGESAAGAGAGEREPMGLVRLSTERATQVSDALAHMPVLDADRARKWVEAWRRSGFL